MKDRLSQLSDAILCSHILCKLNLKDAVRCSVLSRRWKSLWPQLPHLDFEGYSEEIIDHILLLHSAPLESFDVDLYFDEDYCCHPYKIWRWIRRAALNRVKRIKLVETLFCECELHPLDVPTSLFSCDFLRDLCLFDFEFTRMPSYFVGFKHLIKCSLFNTSLDDYIVEQLIALCPRLEDLTLGNCIGLNSLKICASNLRKLSFDLRKTQQLTVRCLQLTAFDLHLTREKRMDKIPNAFEIEIPICENLSIDCIFLRQLPRMKQLSKIVLCNAQYVTCDSKWYEYVHYSSSDFQGNVPSLNLLKGLPNLEELCIDSACFEDLRTEGDMQGLPLVKLKKLYVNVSAFGVKEISLLRRLLMSASALRTIGISLPNCHGNHHLLFTKKLWELKRSNAKVSLFITESRPYYPRCNQCAESREIMTQVTPMDKSE